MQLNQLDSPLLSYLIDEYLLPGERVPTLNELSSKLGLSVGKLREQLEVARTLGFVSVRPRKGIKREPFDFKPAILISLLFSLGTGETQFKQFSAVRQAIEQSMWYEATAALTSQDKQQLLEIVSQAWQKLRSHPVHVPNNEHRQFHLKIFSRLENPFVQGLLESYWDAYEAIELTRFANYQYWVDVWTFHERIAEALVSGEFAQGLALLTEHFCLLPTEPVLENS